MITTIFCNLLKNKKNLAVAEVCAWPENTGRNWFFLAELDCGFVYTGVRALHIFHLSRVHENKLVDASVSQELH